MTGTISRRVVDSTGGVLPGVTAPPCRPRFRRESNGQLGKWDYILTLLLPGTYTITFTLSGFQEVQRVTPARTPVLPLEVSLGVGVSEGVVCVGRAAEVPVQTAQVATNFRKSSWRR